MARPMAPDLPALQPQANAFAADDYIEPAYAEPVEDDFDTVETDWQPEPYVDPAPEPVAAPRVTPITLDRRPVVQHAVKKPAQPSTPRHGRGATAPAF